MTQSIGPPSLAQGTRIAVGFSTSISRFIPACAGNSSKSMPGAPSNTVHPRLRGELKSIEGIDICWCGSSPLTRGTLNAGRGSRNFYAGSSPLTRGTRLVFTGSIFPIPVHPRLRGELSVSSFRSPSSPGSSPLTRGTQTQPEQCFMNRRFIPAYAGNSSAQLRFLALDAVHPRLRGELHRKAVKTICSTGSSPLTRGTRFHQINHVS